MVTGPLVVHRSRLRGVKAKGVNRKPVTEIVVKFQVALMGFPWYRWGDGGGVGHASRQQSLRHDVEFIAGNVLIRVRGAIEVHDGNRGSF